MGVSRDFREFQSCSCGIAGGLKRSHGVSGVAWAFHRISVGFKGVPGCLEGFSAFKGSQGRSMGIPAVSGGFRSDSWAFRGSDERSRGSHEILVFQGT